MKKIILFTLIVLFSINLTFGQKTLKTPKNNSLIVIENDTFALVSREEIVLSKQKYEYDNLMILSLRDSVNTLTELLINQSKEIRANNSVLILNDSSYSKLNFLYLDLQKDYNKLKKGNLLNGVIGGGLSSEYNLQSQNLNNVAIKINLGLMLRRKYITSFDFGINLNSSIVLCLNFQTIF